MYVDMIGKVVVMIMGEEKVLLLWLGGVDREMFMVGYCNDMEDFLKIS